MDRARNAIRRLLDLSPKEATVIRRDGEVRLPVERISVGDRVLLRPGERIPVDGVVAEGTSFVNQAPITGESVPVSKTPGLSRLFGEPERTGNARNPGHPARLRQFAGEDHPPRGERPGPACPQPGVHRPVRAILYPRDDRVCPCPGRRASGHVRSALFHLVLPGACGPGDRLPLRSCDLNARLHRLRAHAGGPGGDPLQRRCIPRGTGTNPHLLLRQDRDADPRQARSRCRPVPSVADRSRRSFDWPRRSNPAPSTLLPKPFWMSRETGGSSRRRRPTCRPCPAWGSGGG